MAGLMDFLGQMQNPEQADIRKIDNALAMSQAMPAASIAQTPAAPIAAQPQGFMDKVKGYFGDEEKMARLAVGLNSMRMNPDQGIAAVMADRLKTLREQKLAQAQSNKTIDYMLANKIITPTDADALRGNPELAKGVLSAFFSQEKKEDYSTVSGQKLNELMPGSNFDPKGMYSVGNKTGKISEIGSAKTTTNVNVDASQKGDVKWAEAASGSVAKRFEGLVDQGDVAAGLRPELQSLSMLLEQAPTGPLQGRLATAFPGFSTAGDAYNAIINRIAPKLRVVGSGSSSDRDIDLLLSSMGSLRNDAAANRLIHRAFMDKIDLDQRRADIANQAFSGQITRQEANQQLTELNKQSIISPELKAMINAASSGAKGGMTATSIGAPADVFSKMSDDQRAKYSRMTPDQKARANREILAQ